MKTDRASKKERVGVGVEGGEERGKGRKGKERKAGERKKGRRK